MAAYYNTEENIECNKSTRIVLYKVKPEYTANLLGLLKHDERVHFHHVEDLLLRLPEQEPVGGVVRGTTHDVLSNALSQQGGDVDLQICLPTAQHNAAQQEHGPACKVRTTCRTANVNSNAAFTSSTTYLWYIFRAMRFM